MNRVVSVIVGLIATLFGLMLARGLAPVASAATVQDYTYDRYHHALVPTDATERGPIGPGRPTGVDQSVK
jgi:hypothetical protein